MTLVWPWALPLLLTVPALAAAYLWQLRRRRREAVRHPDVSLVRAAAPPSRRWRRHAPVALVLLALALLGLAGARPQVEAAVPVSGRAVIVAVDVSGSMCATDVRPNRLAAAQQAVRRFVSRQDEGTRIGLVVFSGFAQVAVAPTTDRQPLLAAVDTLTTGRGTVIGAAILKSVDAIAEIDPDVAPASVDDPGATLPGGPVTSGSTPPSGTPGATAGPGPSTGPGAPDARGGQGAPRGPVPEIVVLLTDGANTRGVTPQVAAKVAASRGVRVYPIGFGTTRPVSLVCTRQQLDGIEHGLPRWGGPGTVGRDGHSFLVIDEPALKEVARTTGGQYFRASSADQLQGVLDDLPTQVQGERRQVEVSPALAGLGLLAVVAAVVLSARWRVFP
jgi:Ca-activated chloride channel family protein